MLLSEGKGLRGKWSVIKLLALIVFFLNYSKAGSPMSVPSLRMEMESRCINLYLAAWSTLIG